MRKSSIFILLLFGLGFLAAVGVRDAAASYLFEWAINVDGVIYDSLSSTTLPGGVTSNLDPTTGLGAVTFNGNANYVAAYFDFDSGTSSSPGDWTSDTGSPSGSAASGETYEINDSSVLAPSGWSGNPPKPLTGLSGDVLNGAQGDVSYAIGWSSVNGTVTFTTASSASGLSGLYLEQDLIYGTDNSGNPISDGQDFLGSAYTPGNTSSTPEPCSLLLCGGFLFGFALRARIKARS